jgi:excinuclease ABC subunit B
MSEAMRIAIDETTRRREAQLAYNAAHGITPTTVKKAVQDILERHKEEKVEAAATEIETIKGAYNLLVPEQRSALIKRLEREMLEKAKNLEFEAAASLRDEIARIKGGEA